MSKLYNTRELRLECLKEATRIFVQSGGQKAFAQEAIINLANSFFDFVTKDGDEQ